MAGTIMLRNGAWRVELIAPLNGADGKSTIDAIEFAPAKLSTTIRWGEGKIPSTLALMSELSKVPELVLRQLGYPDVDRVMTAFYQILPQSIRTDFEKGLKPFASDMEDIPPSNAILNDPVDPRFPHVEGPVTRIKSVPRDEPQPDDEGTGFDVKPPETMKAAS